MCPRAARSESRILSKEVALRLLDHGYHRWQQSCFQKVATLLGSSGPNLLHPHFTASPLSSATLLASYLRHRILRNLEHVTTPVIRRTLDLTSFRHPAWRHASSQEARQVQVEQVLSKLFDKRDWLMVKVHFEPTNKMIQIELEQTRDLIQKLESVLEHLKPVVEGNLHPSSLHEGANAFLTPSEVAQLPSPIGAVRGILIKIKGPRRGTRCMTWQKAAGRISINSVDYVAAEEAKLPIPSKLGIFGLTVRIVYGRKNRLIDPTSVLPVLDRHNFAFVHPQKL